MTGEELQKEIFKYRLETDGSVLLNELPSAKQLNLLLYIDPEKDYYDYTPKKAMNDIILYYKYLNFDWRFIDEFDY